MLDLVGRTVAFRLRIRAWRDNVAQQVRATSTAGGSFQVESGRAFVVSRKTCWKQTTVGRDYRRGPIGPFGPTRTCGQ